LLWKPFQSFNAINHPRRRRTPLPLLVLIARLCDPAAFPLARFDVVDVGIDNVAVADFFADLCFDFPPFHFFVVLATTASTVPQNSCAYFANRTAQSEIDNALLSTAASGILHSSLDDNMLLDILIRLSRTSQSEIDNALLSTAASGRLLVSSSEDHMLRVILVKNVNYFRDTVLSRQHFPKNSVEKKIKIHICNYCHPKKT